MAIIRAYLIDIKYVLERNVEVILVCRDENGRIIHIKDYYRPNFFVLLKKGTDVVQTRARISRIKKDQKNYVTETKEERKQINCSVEKVIRIFTSRPETIRYVRGEIISWPEVINSFEDDISLTRRYLLEKNIVPYSMFEAEVIEKPDEGFLKLVGFRGRDISFAEPNTLAISAYYRTEGVEEGAISAICIKSNDQEKIITWLKPKFSEGIDIVASEQQLLERAIHHIHDIRPDILLFEDKNLGLDTIISRAKKYNLRININLDGSEPYVNYITGRTRTVGINEIFIRGIIRNFINFSIADKSLNDIYSNLEGIANITSVVGSDDENSQIISLVQRKANIDFMLFSSLFNSLTELFRLVGLRAADLLNFSLNSVIEWTLIRECILRGYVVPNKQRDDYTESRHPLSKRYNPVINPVSGIYDKVIVIDLLPIYPGIIINQNLSPDTLECDPSGDGSRGILAKVLSDISERLNRINEALKTSDNEVLKRRKGMLAKIHDHFYNYLNSPLSRWFSHDFMGILNSRASDIINLLIVEANKSGSVIYSDYNEMLVHVKDPGDCINKLRLLKPESSGITIKRFAKRTLILPNDSGFSRKRFALLEDNGKVYQTNLIKRSMPEYLKKVIESIIKALLNNYTNEKIKLDLAEYIKNIEHDKVKLKDMLINFKLSKNPDDYGDKSLIGEVIKQIKAKGANLSKGEKVYYYIKKGEGNITSRTVALKQSDIDNLGNDSGYDSSYDSSYYIERLLMPAIEDLLMLKGIRRESVSDGDGQAGLGEFV